MGVRHLLFGPDPRWRVLAKAVVVGVLLGGTAMAVGIYPPWRLAIYTPLLAAVTLAALMSGPPSLRRATWLLVGLWSLLLLTIAYTDLAETLQRRIAEDDGPVPSDVIVVLSTNTQGETIGSAALYRMLAGMRLLRRGVAPNIVFTGDPGRPDNQFHRLAPELLAALHADTSGVVPFEAVDGVRITTWWEARSIRQMAEARGWRRVLVVTSPCHTRRAKAMFRRNGLDAAVTPCLPVTGPGSRLTHPWIRFEVFRSVAYECAAQLYYHAVGRL